MFTLNFGGTNSSSVEDYSMVHCHYSLA